MSRLTEYYDWVKIVIDCLSGYWPSGVEPFRFRQDPVALPLYSIQHVETMRRFYRIRLTNIQNTNLAPSRKLRHDRLCQETASAYRALQKEQQSSEAGIEYFITPLKHIQAALEWAIQLRDYDNVCPVSHSELSFATDDLQARKYWLRFKLDSIRPCLLLLVQLLSLILPKHQEFWEEAEESLETKDWHSQFIYDSKHYLDSTLLDHPKMSDVLWRTSPNEEAEGSNASSRQTQASYCESNHISLHTEQLDRNLGKCS